MMCSGVHCIPLDPSETRTAGFARGVLFGEDWIVSPIGRLNSLTWWVARSEKDTPKAFRTDIYGSALLRAA